jgi:phosphoribosylaminoimidazolecarboxamide formyltransferase / IMP cyclohydrolase
MTRIRRAILSCYDKTGVVEVGRLLNEFRVEIVSTTGTLKVLREAGVPAISIADFTGVPELMNGRVKSLHPKVHAGLLGLRDSKLHVEQMEAYKLQWIDLVLVNLHPLEKIIEQPGISTEEVLEQVDIGGLAMIRSAAKNFRYVTVAVNPKRYSVLMHEMRALDGAIAFATRYRMAQEAFACTADYDRRLADFLRQTEPPKE